MRNSVRTLLLLLSAALQAVALDIASLQPQGYVSDFAGVLDPVAKADLERYAGMLEKSTGVQLALVTMKTLEGEPIEDVANELFRRWGIGQKGKDEGLLLLLVVGDRHSRLEVGRGLEPIITDGTSGTLLREMRPALREQRYSEALGTAAHSLGERIARAKNVSIEEQQRPRRRVREQPGFELPWPMLLGGAFLLLWIMSKGGGGRRGGGGLGGFLPGLILGNMLGRGSYGGYGGGGFGGYDSGDTFGGFGGGDSGGGGASSDW